MKRKILSVILSLVMLFSVISSLGSITASAATLNVGVSMSNPSKMPTITPPANTHPRVMFTENSLETIRAFWDEEENAAAVEKFEEWATSSINTSESIGKVSSSNNYRRDYLNVIQAKAFDYILNRNNADSTIKSRALANGQTAVAAMSNFVSKVSYASESDICRQAGYTVYVASEVYDWCYDIMDDSQRSTFITKCENIMKNYFEAGYPATGQNNITGHAGEYQLFRDLLSFGIATYDEKPAVYNNVMSRIEHEMVPARKWFYESGAPYQGDMYGSERYVSEIYAEVLVQRMTDGRVSLFTDSTHQGFKDVPMHWLYMHRPDGRLFTRGDDNTLGWGLTGYNTYHYVANFFAGNLYGDKFIKGEAFRRTADFDDEKYDNYKFNAIAWLIVNNPDVAAKKTGRTELAENKYFESPAGEIVAKTTWDYLVRGSNGQGHTDNDAVAAYMRIGEYYGGNHDDLDSGSFQLYYKGILASASGFYDDYSSDHSQNYRKRTISHNALTISGDDDASYAEKVAFFGGLGSGANDGGQKITNPEIDDFATWTSTSGRYKRATVLDHFVSDTYSYIKGDLTPAYASTKLDSSVPVVRNMAFIETNNEEVPAFMVVYDKMKGKSSSNVPQFNLHTQAEPSISGNTSTVVVDGGKLTMKTLLPASASINKIGGSGSQFKVGSSNYAPSTVGSADESGWGRIEIKPTNASGTTEFLNVLAVSDAGYTGTISAETITGSNVTGAKVLNEVVLFSQSAGRVTTDTTFTITGSETDLNVKILGIKPGYWMVKNNNQLVAIPQSLMDSDGNGATLSFTGDAGTYELTYVGETLEWQQILSDDMDTINGTTGEATIYDYYDMTNWDVCYRTAAEAASYSINGLATPTDNALRVAASKNKTSSSTLILENSPLYNASNSSIVRFEFDFANDTGTNAYINLVGEVDGTLTETNQSSPTRFIFTSGQKFYYDNGDYRKDGHSCNTKTWYRMRLDIDCMKGTYDVYVDGELSMANIDLPYDFDSIYGITLTAKGTSSATTKIFIDNLKFYNVKMAGLPESYAVTLNTNGGTINSGNITKYTEGEYVVLPTDVTKDNYTFGGWYTNSDFSGDAVASIPVDATGDKTFYAKWVAIPGMGDGVEWIDVLGIDFEANSTLADYEDYYTTTNADICFPIGDAKAWTNNSGEEVGSTSYRVATTGGNQSLNLIETASPLYSVNSKKVRFQFDTAKDNTKQDFFINLVGDVDGEVVTTNQSAKTRFVFQTGDKFYFDNDDYRWEGPKYVAKEWNKVTIDVDCETDTYDVYVNDELVCRNNNLAYDFDQIYGISFTAKKNDSTNRAFVDNIRYYVDKSEFTTDLTFGTVSAVYDGETFYCDAPVTGNLLNKADLYIIIAVYNNSGEFIYSVKVPYANYTGSVETIARGLSDVSYVKAFAWNMRTLVPIGVSVNGTIAQ